MFLWSFLEFYFYATFKSKRSKSNTLVWGGLPSILLDHLHKKLEAAQEVNFNQVGIYYLYHMLSRPSFRTEVNLDISCLRLLSSPPPIHLYMWNYMKINSRETQTMSMLNGGGEDGWTGERKGGNGAVGSSLLCFLLLESFSGTSIVGPKTWGPGESTYQSSSSRE